MTINRREIYHAISRTGRGAEAAAFREQTRLRLRGEGLSKREATESAWQRMAEKFLPEQYGNHPQNDQEAPLPSDPEPITLGPGLDITSVVCELADRVVIRWSALHGVRVPAGADIALAVELATFWANGLMKKIPQPVVCSPLTEGGGISGAPLQSL